MNTYYRSLFLSKRSKLGAYPSPYAIKSYPELAGSRCWEWTGYILSGGYGQWLTGRKACGESLAHRIAYKLKYPKRSIQNKCVCHKCDNRKCIRPSHLFDGSHKVNIRDRMNKGRSRYRVMCGVSSGRSCLSKRQVLRIRCLYASGMYSTRALASIFDISKSAVHSLVAGISYRQLSGSKLYVDNRKLKQTNQ